MHACCLALCTLCNVLYTSCIKCVLVCLLVWLPALAPASLSGSGRQPGTGSHSGWLHAVSTCFGSSALSSFICCLQDGA